MSPLSSWLKRAEPIERRALQRRILVVEQLEERVMPSLLGQQLFPADYPWNQNIAAAPLANNSAAIIAHIGASVKVHPDWGNDSAANGTSPLYGIPYNVVHGNSPTVTKVNVIIDNYPGESDIVAVPMPTNPVIEGDYQNGPNANGGGYNAGQRGDSHLIVWDVDNNIAYELYGATRPSDPKLFPNTSAVELAHSDGKWHAAQESVWNMSAESFRALGNTSADAAGLSILAGLVRPDEGLPAASGGQGAITHALRFTLPSGDVSPQYIYPASHVVNVSSGSTKLPFGSRLRLMNTPAVNAVISGLQPEAQIIAHAMQQYGLVLADIGSAMFVSGASAAQDANNNISSTWNMNDVLGLSGLTAGNFEVVNLAPVVTSLSAASGAAGSTITVVGQNFSGAAGHLSVSFGGVLSPSVTFVDDSHITAVVPTGSGTVPVQVQSGVNATDPNNPTNNVNNPIFGYGKSAAVAADLFSYSSGQTISGANSTASFAAPTVAVGGSDTVTIVVKDTTGNSVTGLLTGAFGFSLIGGSGGNFGTVTETATPGTYSASFTATLAGAASTLRTTVNGVVVTAMPTVTVVAGPAITSANSVVYNAGVGGTFTMTSTGVPTATLAETQTLPSGVTFLDNGNGTGTLTVAASTAAGVYNLIFTAANGTGSNASQNFALFVASLPVVTTQPTSQTANLGNSATFTSAASGTPSPTVLWQLSTNGGGTWTNMPGAISTTLTLNNLGSAVNGFQYRAVFSNTLGMVPTNAATLTVATAPTVTANPVGATTGVGGIATFIAAATGGNPTPILVQWQVSTAGPGGPYTPLGNGGVYSGVTTNTLSIAGAAAALSGNYYQAVFSNSSVGPNLLTATTTPALLSVGGAPVVTSNPVGQTINSGASANFTAAANPGSPASTNVQWQLSSSGGATWTNLSDGGFYSGTTTNTLTITGAAVTLNGDQYRAVFSNAAPSSVVTTAATLIVLSPYVQAAAVYAYYAWQSAYRAHADGFGSSTTLNYAYLAFQYAQLASKFDAQGNQAASQACSYYVFVYGYNASINALTDLANSSYAELNSYYAYLFSGLSWKAAHQASLGG